MIYRYMQAERTLKALSSGLFHYVSLLNTNDLFESRPSFIGVMPAEEEAEYRSFSPDTLLAYYRDEAINSGDSQGKATEYARDKHEMFSNLLSMPVQDRPKVLDELISELASKAVVLCCSSTATNHPMWAHYAADHTGMLIGFDETNEYFSPSSGLKILKVAYREERPRVYWTTLTGDDFLSVKSRDWAYEEEWRHILPASRVTTSTKSGGLVRVPPDCIREVVLGFRTEPQHAQELRRVLAANSSLAHIRVRRIVTSETDYRLDLGDILA